ncbi:hypothetical protein IGI04_003979 [Brassica rapa subsp. trilocularis]|uniref:HMA domain-containing protein n=1 Tax=Brassica rapa subsp. trilocularis TaxID=1813537 RepID=A0ABQ7NZY4_BRACM|nr:hypothetical protein IGI04_003979 [Brassica rapa subsp. trilocularis]
MRDYLPKYLNAFLLAFATFAVVFAIFIAKDPNTSHHLYFSTSSSSLWTSSFSSAFITEKRKRNGSNPGSLSWKRDKKVEAELATARALIREAQLNPNSTTSSPLRDEDYVPHGEIYRNPYAFHRSYLLMEKMFKIYVYEEGDPPIFHYGLCKDIYSMEGLFLNFMENDVLTYRTRDPDKAHVYFLPFSVVMILHHLFDPVVRDKAVLERVIVDYVQIISEKYPYWNTSDGFDHFMLSCHDWGHRATWYVKKLFFNSIRVLCNANISEYFNPEKDAPFPEINLQTGEINNLTGGLDPMSRTTLAFFAGQSHGKIRPVLLSHWKEKDKDILVYEDLPGELDYKEMMRKSRFCICPSGHEVASPRVPEAIYSGCVPVLISENYVLPFSDVLNWEKFSVSVSVKEIPELKRILMDIPEDRYKKLYEGVKQVQRHILVNDPPKRYDQKILIRVTMTDDKARAKAMKTAVKFKGVSAVEIKGDHRNQIEVTGVEVDMIGLTNTLRRKVACAELVSVNKVEPPKPEEDKKPEEKKPEEKKPDEAKPEEKKPDEKKPEEEKQEPCHCHPPCHQPCHQQPWPYGYSAPSSYHHPCDPYGYNARDYIGEPVYNHEPNCTIL